MFVTVLSVAIIHEHRDSVVIYSLVFPAAARYWVTRYRTNMAPGLISERLIFSSHEHRTPSLGRMWTPLLVIITFLCLGKKRLPPLLRFFKLRLPLHFAVLVPWIHGYFPLWEWNVRNGGNYIVDSVVGSGRHCWSLAVVIFVHSAVFM